MGQKFVKKDTSVKILAKNLMISQLGEIIDNESYNGMIVTKIFNGDIIAVYSPPNCNRFAFESTWTNTNATTFHVRILESGEQVILSND